MRATSFPTALTVAAAAVALMAAGLGPLAVPSAALAERWLRPVPGEVARPFGYARAAPFARGAHRGADLAAAPGTIVRSACAGRVVHAGAVAGPDQVVSVSCGDRRVSYLPLASVAVRPDATIRVGTRLGTLAPGHGGLHLGVRRESDPFGYEDPSALLAPTAQPPPPATRPITTPARPPSMPVFEPARRTPPTTERRAPRIAAWPAAPPRPLAGPAPAELAPWPVWLGLAALLTGAVGSASLRTRRRAATRQRAPAHAPAEAR